MDTGPSSSDLQSSLALPFVIAYMAYAWASIEKKAITSSEIGSSEDKY